MPSIRKSTTAADGEQQGQSDEVQRLARGPDPLGANDPGADLGVPGFWDMPSDSPEVAGPDLGVANLAAQIRSVCDESKSNQREYQHHRHTPIRQARQNVESATARAKRKLR